MPTGTARIGLARRRTEQVLGNSRVVSGSVVEAARNAGGVAVWRAVAIVESVPGGELVGWVMRCGWLEWKKVRVGRKGGPEVKYHLLGESGIVGDSTAGGCRCSGLRLTRSSRGRGGNCVWCH